MSWNFQICHEVSLNSWIFALFNLFALKFLHLRQATITTDRSSSKFLPVAGGLHHYSTTNNFGRLCTGLAVLIWNWHVSELVYGWVVHCFSCKIGGRGVAPNFSTHTLLLGPPINRNTRVPRTVMKPLKTGILKTGPGQSKKTTEALASKSSASKICLGKTIMLIRIPRVREGPKCMYRAAQGSYGWEEGGAETFSSLHPCGPINFDPPLVVSQHGLMYICDVYTYVIIWRYETTYCTPFFVFPSSLGLGFRLRYPFFIYFSHFLSRGESLWKYQVHFARENPTLFAEIFARTNFRAFSRKTWIAKLREN